MLERERPFVVLDPAVVGEQQTDGLGCIHRAAATNGQQAIDALAPILLRGLVDVFAARVGLDVRYFIEGDTCLVQAGVDAVQQACCLDPGIGHDEDACQAKCPQMFTCALAQAGFHHDFAGE
ncbi:hypothetical protein D9M68_697140 [compost metagenome]